MEKQGKRRSSADDVACNSNTPHSTGRSKKRDVAVIENPDWLPKGWITEIKTRVSGCSAGITDKYYYDPVANRRFASKKKVFEFLEIDNFRECETKCKKDDPGSTTSAEEKMDTGLGGGGTESTFQNFSTSESTCGIDANKRPSKVIWVLNNSEESWVPFVSDEEKNGSNKKGEKPIPHGNSVDSCGRDQLKNGVSENTNPSKEQTNERSQPEIDLNKPIEGSPIVSPFGDSWPDPCLEFAFKTLTGAIPIFDDNSALQDAFQHYFKPQTKADEKLWSTSTPSNKESPGCNECTELPSFTEQKASSSGKEFDESNDNRIIFSVSDGLPDIGMKVNNLMRHQAKDLLEPLGRKLCKKALDFLMKNGHPSMLFEKQAKTIPLPFCLSQRLSN